MGMQIKWKETVWRDGEKVDETTLRIHPPRPMGRHKKEDRGRPTRRRNPGGGGGLGRPMRQSQSRGMK